VLEKALDLDQSTKLIAEFVGIEPTGIKYALVSFDCPFFVGVCLLVSFFCFFCFFLLFSLTLLLLINYKLSEQIGVCFGYILCGSRSSERSDHFIASRL
jgi:hypothetical protein